MTPHLIRNLPVVLFTCSFSIGWRMIENIKQLSLFCCVIGLSVIVLKAFAKLPASVKPGVVTGQALVDLLDHAKEVGFAIPGVNVVGTSSINACMEAAKQAGGPVMVTVSRGGGQCRGWCQR